MDVGAEVRCFCLDIPLMKRDLIVLMSMRGASVGGLSAACALRSLIRWAMFEEECVLWMNSLVEVNLVWRGVQVRDE